MRVDQSDLPYELEDVYFLESGTFYFFKEFIISEIKEGVLFNWEMAQDIIDIALMHYGNKSEIAYISNRIHSYSLVPQDWLKFFEARHTLRAFAVVTYNKQGLFNVMMEKFFFKSKIRKFSNLYEAAGWVMKNAPTLRKGEIAV